MDRLCGMASDPDRGVRYQLALSLGECQNPIVAQPLGELLLANLEDKWMRAAVASSSARFPAEILKYILTRVPDRKSTRLNSSHTVISYAVFCLKKKKHIYTIVTC